jgi:anthranilate synthase/aminodeoxychorismate synthase-like glutamine amidotransferase
MAERVRDNASVPRVLVIDNYDSFVYNLVQYLGELGAEPVVHRHDAVSLAEMRALEPDAVLISPGPGRPSDAGLSNDAIRAFGESGTPVLGVCLGLQCIGELYGGSVVRAPHVMHGKTSEITHSGAGVFAGLPVPFTATRYHSLVVARDTVPAVLEITAESEDSSWVSGTASSRSKVCSSTPSRSSRTAGTGSWRTSWPGRARKVCAPPRDFRETVVEQRREHFAVELTGGDAAGAELRHHDAAALTKRSLEP